MRLVERTTEQLPLLRAGDFVVLLHGTFASKAGWVNPDRPLSKALRDKVPGIEVVPFRWSGTNSHSARLAAAARLAELVSEIGARHKSARVHFVAHSHGGNVVLLALKNLDVVAKTRSITFFGTPFFQIRPRPFIGGVKRFSELLGIVGPVMLTVLVLSVGVFIHNPTFFWGLFVLVFAALGWYYFYYFFKGIRTFENFLFLRITNLLAVKQERSLAWLKAAIPTRPVFIATTSADEAGSWLRFLNSVSAVPHRIWKFLCWLLLPLLVLGFLFDQFADFYSYIALLVGVDILHAFAPSLLVFGAILCLAIFTVFIPFLSVITGVIVRGSFLAFGWEGLFTPLIISIVPAQTPSWPLPPGSRNTLTTTSGSGLRHSSFYSDTTTISDLCEWLIGNAPTQSKSVI